MALEKAGLHAVLEGVGGYVVNANRILAANTQMGTSFGTVAAKSGSLIGVLAKVGIGVGVLAGIIGGVAVTKAAKFETIMAQVDALTNATAEDTKRLGDAVLEMSKRIPKSPEELGTAAYFVLSSGINDVGLALQVVEQGAKAAAAGLGETKDVVSVVTSVMNAYGPEVISAARATDILVATVREGKGEPAEFAQALGLVIPIAAQAGASFEEVGAFLAVATNTGSSASEAVTQLRGVLAQLIAPSDKAKKQLAAVGLSADKVRKSIKDKGLLATLFDLRRRLEGNVEAMDAIFPDVRGLIGFLSVIESQGDQTKEALRRISDAAGITDEAFERVRKATAAQASILKNQLNVALIKLGSKALPVVNKAIGYAIANFPKLEAAVASVAAVVAGVAAAIAGKLSPALAFVKELARLFQLGFEGGKIGGAFSTLEKVAFGLGQGASFAVEQMRNLFTIVGELAHLFTLGFEGGQIGGQFSAMERLAFRAGQVLREDLLPAARDVAAFLLQVGTATYNVVTGLVEFARESGLAATFFLGLRTVAEGFVAVMSILGPVISTVVKFLREHEIVAYALGAALVALVAFIAPVPVTLALLITALGFARAHFDDLKAAVASFFDSIPGPVLTFITFMQSEFLAKLDLVLTYAKIPFDLFRGFLITLWQLVHADFSGAWETIKTTAQTVADDVVRIIRDSFSGLPEALFNLGKAAGEKLLEGLKSIPGVSELLDVVGGIGGAVSKGLAKIGLSEGGIVSSPTHTTLGEGFRPEAVIPLTKPARARQILAALPPGMLAGRGASATFAPQFNVSGATIDQMRTEAIRAVDTYFRQLRVESSQRGAPLRSGIG